MVDQDVDSFEEKRCPWIPNIITGRSTESPLKLDEDNIDKEALHDTQSGIKFTHCIYQKIHFRILYVVHYP